jgi:hypothetical protein
MKSHYVNDSNNFIGGWYMKDTQLCDDIYQYLLDMWKIGKAGPGNVGNNSVRLEVKKSIDTLIDLNPELHNKYCENLQLVLNKYIEKYPYCNYYTGFKILEPISVQYYEKGGGFYAWHTEHDSDRVPFRSRHLAFMTYLNDVTDDGETEYFHQDLKVKPEKGLTLIWPTDWTFTHRGIPSSTQEKCIITGWFSYYE